MTDRKTSVIERLERLVQDVDAKYLFRDDNSQGPLRGKLRIFLALADVEAALRDRDYAPRDQAHELEVAEFWERHSK